MTPSLKQERQPGRKHHVNIQISGAGCMYAHPDGQNAATIVVKKGDHVKWRCDHGNYAVLFKHHSPFAEIAFHGRKGNETAEAMVVGESGSYHYSVTVSLESGLIVDDPEVIVDGGEAPSDGN